MYDLISQMETTGDQARRPVLPGTTASGLASPYQLLGSATCVAIQAGMTATTSGLLIGLPNAPSKSFPIVDPLKADAYPVLEGIWDNDDDAVFDAI